MSILNSIVGWLPDSQLSLGGLFQRLRAQGRLRSLVLEALAKQLVQDEAQRAGLSVTREEIQCTADAFRRRNGLSAAADTHAWLSGHGMSVEDFQVSLEHDLLTAKLKQHLTASRIVEHFQSHQADYDRWRLVQLCVGRDDLVNELACQVREEGREMDAVAAEQGIPLRRLQSYRRDLPEPIAASLASAETGQLVGPVVTSQGFLLALIEERQPAALDSATRQHIENELFMTWVVERMRDAKVNLAITEPT